MNELDPDKWSEERVEQLLSERNRAMELSYVFGGRDPHPNFTKIKERLLASKTAQAVSQAAANTAASQVTSEVAIRQEDCPCHGRGCRVDHGAIRYARTINQRVGKGYYVQVMEDTGTRVNWISPRLVTELRYELQDASDQPVFEDFSGNEFTPKYTVSIPLVGKTRETWYTDCYVGPDYIPLDGVIVGTGFIQSTGHAHTVFYDKPEGPALIMMQKKVTVNETQEIKALRAQADRAADEIARRIEQQKSGAQMTQQSNDPRTQSTPSSTAESAGRSSG